MESLAGKPSAPGWKRAARVTIPSAIPLQHKALQRFTVVGGLTPGMEHGNLPALARMAPTGPARFFWMIPARSPGCPAGRPDGSQTRIRFLIVWVESPRAPPIVPEHGGILHADRLGQSDGPT